MRPILLLDDVSSELDRARTAALFSFLREQRGQVFLTTTRPELIDTGDDGRARRDFVVRSGVDRAHQSRVETRSTGQRRLGLGQPGSREVARTTLSS